MTEAAADVGGTTGTVEPRQHSHAVDQQQWCCIPCNAQSHGLREARGGGTLLHLCQMLGSWLVRNQDESSLRVVPSQQSKCRENHTLVGRPGGARPQRGGSVAEAKQRFLRRDTVFSLSHVVQAGVAQNLDAP